MSEENQRSLHRFAARSNRLLFFANKIEEDGYGIQWVLASEIDLVRKSLDEIETSMVPNHEELRQQRKSIDDEVNQQIKDAGGLEAWADKMKDHFERPMSFDDYIRPVETAPQGPLVNGHNFMAKLPDGEWRCVEWHNGEPSPGFRISNANGTCGELVEPVGWIPTEEYFDIKRKLSNGR